MIRKKFSEKKFKIGVLIYWIGAAVIGAYLLLPFFTLFFKAFMSIDDILELRLFPSYATFCDESGKFRLYKVFANFINAFAVETTAGVEGINFFKAIWNSVYIMFLRTVGVTISSFICAFALSRIKFRGRKIVFTSAMVTVLLPGIVTMIPLRIIYYNFNWLGTLYPLWVPACFGGGFMVIFMEMQFIKSIPSTMDEAAMIDGANWLQIAFMIILPLIAPVLIYEAVGTAIGSWNDFMAPLTYIPRGDYDLYTLPLAFFQKYTGKPSITDTKPNEQMAMSLVMMLPIFILFAFFKNQMINGVSIGAGIKG